MEHAILIKELHANQRVFKELLSNLESDLCLWRPQPGKWNLLDIVCHLVDEEREDFRYRLKHVLETPQLPMPSIDPVSWVTERKYQERDYEQTVGRLMAERTASIDWLHSLSNQNWDNAYNHPTLGKLSANMFLHNWVAHDYLHIRQIVNNRYHYLKFKSLEPLDYAGSW